MALPWSPPPWVMGHVGSFGLAWVGRPNRLACPIWGFAVGKRLELRAAGWRGGWLHWWILRWDGLLGEAFAGGRAMSIGCGWLCRLVEGRISLWLQLGSVSRAWRDDCEGAQL